MTAPVSLIASAAGAVDDVRRTLTPQLVAEADTVLVLVDLGAGRNRMGGSILAQVTHQIGNETPDVDEAARLAAFVDALRDVQRAGRCSRTTTARTAVSSRRSPRWRSPGTAV